MNQGENLEQEIVYLSNIAWTGIFPSLAWVPVPLTVAFPLKSRGEALCITAGMGNLTPTDSVCHIAVKGTEALPGKSWQP